MLSEFLDNRCEAFILVIAALLLLSSSEVFSQDDAFEFSLHEDAFFEEIPTVVTPTRLNQQLDDVPVAVTVISREMIAASGATEFVDILRMVPGFQVAHLSGNLFVVSKSGVGVPWFAGMQVLVDGRSAYNAAFSGLDWIHLGVSLEDIESIEVVRGLASSTFGANAVQGAVNIITRQPNQEPGASGRVLVGSQETRDAYIRYASNYGLLDYQISFEHRDNQGFDYDNDEVLMNSLHWQGVSALTPKDEVDLKMGFTRSRLGGEIGFEFEADDREVDTDYQFVRWTHLLSEDENVYLQLNRYDYRSDQDSRFLLSDWFEVDETVIPMFFGVADQETSLNHFNVDARRYDLEFQHYKLASEQVQFTWGAGYRVDEYRSDLLQKSDFYDGYSGRFSGNIEYKFNRYILNVGAMFEKTTLMNGEVSPRIGLNYKFDEGHAMRVAVSRGYKSPSLHEEHWETMFYIDDGTPIYLTMKSAGNLKPEVRETTEIGYVWIKPSSMFELEWRLYHEKVKDSIHYKRELDCAEQPIIAGSCFRVGNLINYEVDGLEVQISFKPTKDAILRVNYSYAEAEGGITVDTEAHVTEARKFDLDDTVTQHMVGFLASYSVTPSFSISGAYYHVGETNWFYDGGIVDTYNRIDARMAYKFKALGRDFSAELIGHNLGDDYIEYRELVHPNQFETRYYLKLKAQL